MPVPTWRSGCAFAVLAAATANGASCGTSTGGADGGGSEASADAHLRDAAQDAREGPEPEPESGPGPDGAGEDVAAEAPAPDAGGGDAAADASVDASPDRLDGRGDEDGSWVFVEGATASLFCLTEGDASPFCFGTESFPATELAGLKADCTGTSLGKVETVCPSAGLLGCCSLAPGTETVVKCYYEVPEGGAGGPDAAGLKATCKGELGSWTKKAP